VIEADKKQPLEKMRTYNSKEMHFGSMDLPIKYPS